LPSYYARLRIHGFWMIIKICEDHGIAAIQRRC
jgi:hypothetical protein